MFRLTKGRKIRQTIQRTDVANSACLNTLESRTRTGDDRNRIRLIMEALTMTLTIDPDIADCGPWITSMLSETRARAPACKIAVIYLHGRYTHM